MLIFNYIILILLANGAPIIIKYILKTRFNAPVDLHYCFVDSRPLFGPSKTIRGVAAILIITTAVAPLLGFSWQIGIITGFFIVLGDLITSFIKRRFALPASSQVYGFDQLLESLLPTLVCQAMLSFNGRQVVIIVTTFTAVNLLITKFLHGKCRWK